MWLRERLAMRALSAAAVSAAAVALAAVLPAAGAGRPAWPKAWAEQLLRKSFAAATAVCLPLGPAIRQDGENAFREFVCGLVTADGTRYTIRIKPRTRTTWTTVSLERHAPAKEGGGKEAKPRPPHGR